jgi:ribonuclease HII
MKQIICGIDEAGRGPLAGPVTAAAVILPDDFEIELLNDSKKLSEKKRLALEELIKQKSIAWSVVHIPHNIIDEINILNATKLGMEKALNGLKNQPYVVLIDAVKINTSTMQENIIKGDAKSYNIAAASILAKEYRDRLMVTLAEKYSNYGFEKHKGYGTKDHINALKQFGKCEIHRDSFIKNFIN